MACKEYALKNGLVQGTTETDSAFSTRVGVSVHADGYQCMINHPDACKNYCSQVSKNPSGCFSCLSQVQSCTGANGKEACCPDAQLALSCANCMAKNQQNVIQCLHDSAISHQTVIIIVVVCVATVIVIAGIVSAVVIQKRKNDKKNQLLQGLKSRNVSAQTIKSIGRLDANERVYSTVLADIQRTR